jgi:hypothetical protein
MLASLTAPASAYMHYKLPTILIVCGGVIEYIRDKHDVLVLFYIETCSHAINCPFKGPIRPFKAHNIGYPIPP